LPHRVVFTVSMSGGGSVLGRWRLFGKLQQVRLAPIAAWTEGGCEKRIESKKTSREATHTKRGGDGGGGGGSDVGSGDLAVRVDKMLSG
jgi:hypothetical protein